MAEGVENSVKSFREKNMSAFVLGYTGEVGKEVVNSLIRHQLFSRVVLIGRRKVEFSDELHKNLVSFQNIIAEFLQNNYKIV